MRQGEKIKIKNIEQKTNVKAFTFNVIATVFV
jgi:SHS2 domain-containing protein